MIKTKHSLHTPKCSQCESDLILVKEVVEMVEDFLTPITTTIYRCSDRTCQKDIEKKTSARIKLHAEHEIEKEKRTKKNAEYRT